MFKCGLFNVDWADLDYALNGLKESFSTQPETSKIHDKFVIEMPGVKKEDIKVKLQGEFVYVDWTSYKGSHQGRAYYVGSGIEDLKAKYDNGLLHIEVKPKTAGKARDFPIE